VSDLRISPEVRLPVDVAGEAIAILAKRGAGKTNTATVLVEELVNRAGVQTVILDPVGAWWGIRSSADGKLPGLPVPILGGQHGDVQIEQTAGALIADVAVDAGQSLLVDLSDLPSKAAVGRFVTDFAERLFRRKARAHSLLHLVLEEADEFAPQQGRADTARMRGAIEQIVRRGRSRGLGVTLITQRSAVLNKDVLTQADVLIVMRTTGPQDVKAIREWVTSRGDDRGAEVLQSLPGLETGEAWIWNPERDMLARARIRRRETFDSSRTPKAGERRAEPARTASIDLASLGERIQATAEKAKAEDPRELRRRIAELEREVQKAPVGQAEPRVETVVEERIVEVPVLNGQVEDLEQAITAMRDVASQVAAAGEAVRAGAESIAGAIMQWRPRGVARPRAEQGEQKRAATEVQPRAARPTVEAVRRAPARRPVPPAADRADAEVTSSQRRVLDALAWFEAVGVPQPSRPAVAFIAGSRPTSGGFKNNLGALRALGLLDYPQGGRVALTEAGRGVATSPSFAPTVAELQEAVFSAVGGSKATIVRMLVACYPDPLSREELADRVGVPVTSGGFKNNLGALRTLELIDYPQTGYVVALPALFLEEV